MKFLADENLDQQIVERLRQDGHFVWYIAEMEPGVSDDVVLNLANQEGVLLITADKDFGELVFRLGRIASGVVLIRLPGLSLTSKAEIVSRALNQHANECRDAIYRVSTTVITPTTIRICKIEN